MLHRSSFAYFGKERIHFKRTELLNIKHQTMEKLNLFKVALSPKIELDSQLNSEGLLIYEISVHWQKFKLNFDSWDLGKTENEYLKW
jgi:hypothetical protein